jgi:hypothetical protein
MCPDADGETMTNARLAVRAVAFTLVVVVCGKADAQKVDAPSPTSQQHILSLNFTNNGQQLVASVGQQIEITLGTIGGPQYGKAEVSSAAIRLESVALGLPVTPGGPTFTDIFEAAAEGRYRSKFQLSTQTTLTGLNSTPLSLRFMLDPLRAIRANHIRS